jgi:hypothetical protein
VDDFNQTLCTRRLIVSSPVTMPISFFFRIDDSRQAETRGNTAQLLSAGRQIPPAKHN